ncbi:hypothetical protein D9619_003073 [Psilocybe cf. subviscida]|uniref:Uncharacterized protein n=1 Tax=Psilocybe cf. subviscida TaxID=2480587 RepID=A0A8H5AWI2_9AGAR|nr:hypothetical protein D9619_003073 [Psilocybe cf. subviscida]
MMARATRSSAADLKRKRSVDDIQHSDDKHQRTDNDPPPPETLINGHDILQVLETEDTQGLLDRVFPAVNSQDTVSLRALLNGSSSISSLRTAVNHLRPISLLPRAKLSQTAAQQQAFCNLAMSLIEQVPPAIDLSELSSLIPDSPNKSPARPKLSYALVQHLPSGDYWTSLASLPSPSSLPTANAELVAIFPTPSSSTSDKPVPTLGSYSTKPIPARKPPQKHRRVTTGAFLDYGVYASFAPSFDQDGEVVGRNQLGQVLAHREEEKRIRAFISRERSDITHNNVDVNPDLQQPEGADESDQVPDLDLEALLPPEEVASIKAALGNLELEMSVQKLLEQNQRALERLDVLQRQRLTNHPTSTAEEGSEEWDTAQAILESLTILTSLRPRTQSEDGAALMPPSSVLHKLHRSLAVQPSPGWYGTLPSGRNTALRDDSTIKVRSGVATSAAAAATATPASSTPVSAINTFGAYGYAYGQASGYRPQQTGTYTPYKPGQTATYYPNYTQTTTQPQQQQQPFYGTQSYSAGATSQQPYGSLAQQPYAGTYTNWYTPQTAQNGTSSGRGTPQPSTSTTAAPATSSYGTFFNQANATGSGTPTGVRTPAVANTVVATGGSGASGAAAYSPAPAGVVPTLPAHLRTAAPTQANGTATTSFQPQVYYPSYPLAQSQPAR